MGSLFVPLSTALYHRPKAPFQCCTLKNSACNIQILGGVWGQICNDIYFFLFLQFIVWVMMARYMPRTSMPQWLTSAVRQGAATESYSEVLIPIAPVCPPSGHVLHCFVSKATHCKIIHFITQSQNQQTTFFLSLIHASMLTHHFTCEGLSTLYQFCNSPVLYIYYLLYCKRENSVVLQHG